MATSPTSGPGGGGGGAVQTREIFSGLDVTIANGANGDLVWDSPVGTALLDLTNPARPTAVAAGVYAISVSAEPNAGLTVGGYYECDLDLDLTGDDPRIYASSPGSIAADPQPRITLSQTYYIPAGGTVRVLVFNFDGAASRDFHIIGASVQRLS